MSIDKTELPEIYTLYEPKDVVIPLLVDSPHSGRIYPNDFGHACAFRALQETEDNHLEVLLQNAPAYGATLLQCEFPRCYIDVNRAADDIDNALLEKPCIYPIRPTSRSSVGYGLIRRLVKPGMPVYDRLLTFEEIQHRINIYYLNYHKVLQEKLDNLHYNFGHVWYMNMHSMPTSSARTEDGRPVDFVLGDRHGKTCRRDFIYMLKTFLEQAGFRVAMNDPYQGVELISRHGNPAIGRNALQFEISKSLYWNEISQEFLPQAKLVEKLLNNMFAVAAEFIEKELVQQAAD